MTTYIKPCTHQNVRYFKNRTIRICKDCGRVEQQDYKTSEWVVLSD